MNALSDLRTDDAPHRPVVQAVDLTVGYRGARGRPASVLAEIGATLRQGQFAFLLGPNGAGKSTLLRTLVGSQKPLGGRVLLDGQDLSRMSARQRAQRLSVVLTDRVDVGLMSVRALVALGRAPHVGWFATMDGDDRDTVEWALDAAGARSLADRQVIELSDGERQRVMIARALAQRPSILVLDEPTAFLDLTRRVELTALLRQLVDETGLAILMSTHDLELALRTADQIWLVHGDGTFETGCPEDLAHSGSIARAYAGRGISFDHEAGTFVVTAGQGGATVAISGTGKSTHWAARAVQRAGCVPVEQGDSAMFNLSVATLQDRTPSWRLGAGGRTCTGDDFESLVTQLRALSREAARSE
ncbi:ABC transporter ATP-binding protein [Pelagibacterium halotolerans]|uniref:ABC transporter related protein n=1 Tax=Pelagibacterium halotolerans (strain DSM 22347 / JCM 15775 / CGMCC 1.7692 / B2) TaxID=1082931 RepID=G4RAY6_PELHB|nr:ABC transporter ATP-binding protein [Pelagibacterium halotolerans]AEQ53622.1 ABC transporter related protein [Pelagibacterium halotolerans B2]QJR20204.1 ABC transporter ATP-binding protein [Pelagibacterium halotolerans]SEA91416.1 iron complex transport system ATP-binding protein [Pelagibacterium halotolerans]